MTQALPGYREVKPMVFSGLYPIDSDDYPDLRDALEKLTLNDAALSWEPETSDALGFGFRCGFLGLLHMDIVRERLQQREYDLDLMMTMPSVEYEVTCSPTAPSSRSTAPPTCPTRSSIKEIREPFIRAWQSLTPKEFVGTTHGALPGEMSRGITPPCTTFSGRARAARPMATCRWRRSCSTSSTSWKSRTKGYASFDYEITGLRVSDLAVKLDILLGGDPVDALAMLVHRSKADAFGRTMAEKLKEKIPRQQFDVPIQAAIGGRILARETVKAYRKDVIAKCYGGDISRKRKLLEAQKKGKKRMKQVGRVEVPQEAFLAVLEIGDSK